MRRLFPIFLVAIALIALGILYGFVLHGNTAHTRPVPEAGTQAR